MRFCSAMVVLLKSNSLSLFSIRNRTFTYLCFYVSLISLALQLLVFVILLYSLDEKGVSADRVFHNECSFNIYEDIKVLTSIGLDIGISFISLDSQLINGSKILRNNITISCDHCLCSPTLLGVDGTYLSDKRKLLLKTLVDRDFVPITFYNAQPSEPIPDLRQVDIAIFVQRTALFQIVILYPREDNTWWFGDIRSDPSYEAKLAALNLTLPNIVLMKSEGAIDRFELVSNTIDEEVHLMVPKDVSSFLSDISESQFVECNQTRASIFYNRFGSDRSIEAVRFRHKVWKMLARAKTVLESLNIVFWLSSGTALGYFRECDIIAHSKDVDIGVWATAYTDRIIPEMHSHGFHLKISLGLPNDSLELSFVDQSGIKLDMFFFYKDNASHYWNGGTQVKSGKKFKYSFPKFTLCWTLFKDLRLRVPCETEAYIQANYGSDWFTPVKSWDWKTSPFNVQPNGVWTTDQLGEAIKLFV